MRGGRWLNTAAVVTWLICGVPQILSIFGGTIRVWPDLAWISAFLLYGAALVGFLGARPKHLPLGRFVPLALLGIQVATALTLVALSAGYPATTNSTPALLVIVAAQLPYLASSGDRSSFRFTLSSSSIWFMVGLLALANAAVVYVFEGGLTMALTFGLSMGGFMLFAAASSFLVWSEAAARDQLAAVNTELLGTRALLAESSRAEERLRISRDLHDTLGHHLTALSLQLDVAARLADEPSADHIRQAHAITRLLLSDVRDVVSRLRDTSRIDLAQAIRGLPVVQTGLAIHLDLPPSLEIEDRLRAEAMLRCVQEIITNTARHAHARNLWIRLEARLDGVAIHARDDGRGAEVVAYGNGLTGMQERFAHFAGHIEFTPGRGTGFEVHGFLPTPAAA